MIIMHKILSFFFYLFILIISVFLEFTSLAWYWDIAVIKQDWDYYPLPLCDENCRFIYTNINACLPRHTACDILFYMNTIAFIMLFISTYKLASLRRYKLCIVKKKNIIHYILYE